MNINIKVSDKIVNEIKQNGYEVDKFLNEMINKEYKIFIIKKQKTINKLDKYSEIELEKHKNKKFILKYRNELKEIYNKFLLKIENEINIDYFVRAILHKLIGDKKELAISYYKILVFGNSKRPNISKNQLYNIENEYKFYGSIFENELNDNTILLLIIVLENVYKDLNLKMFPIYVDKYYYKLEKETNNFTKDIFF